MAELNSIDQALAAAQQHHMARNLPEAHRLYSWVLSVEPNNARATIGLGMVHFQRRDFARAVELTARAIELKSDILYFYKNHGEACRMAGLLDKGEQAFRTALSMAPNDGTAWHGLALIYEKAERDEDAMAAYRKAIEFWPEEAASYLNLGVLLERRGIYEESLKLYAKALELRPQYANARSANALAHLRQGDWRPEVWADYNWRWRDPHYPGCPLDSEHPIWDGSDLRGRTIAIRAEQGLGDTLQFCRYIPLVIQRGGNVVFEVQPELANLLNQSGGFGRIVPHGDWMPPYDVQMPLMSLPGVFGSTPQTIPAKIPYLAAAEKDADTWRTRIPAGKELRVAIAWGGNPRYPNDRRRSMPLATLAPLAAVPGVKLYSVQVGKPSEQLQQPPAGMEVVDLGPWLKNFTDTAAALMNLDLLISVDTSVAHLAGALGRPAWNMIAYVPDWRWTLEREDTPWYPSMRLFRQSRQDDWSDVIERVTAALAEMVAQPRA